MKITGHVGVYKIKETHQYLDLQMREGEVICCGIVGDPRVKGNIWKGWHFDKEACQAFNNRKSLLSRRYFPQFQHNQKYLDWSKFERIYLGDDIQQAGLEKK